MAQMEWRKYPDELPPADDLYIAAVEDDIEGKKYRTVLPLLFAHDLSECTGSKADKNISGWVDDVNVVYWMPFPEAPEDNEHTPNAQKKKEDI